MVDKTTVIDHQVEKLESLRRDVVTKSEMLIELD